MSSGILKLKKESNSYENFDKSDNLNYNICMFYCGANIGELGPGFDAEFNQKPVRSKPNW